MSDDITTSEILDIMIDVIDDIYYDIMFVEVPEQKDKLNAILEQLSQFALEQDNLKAQKDIPVI
jgi:predicted amino acid-binding ACT domain protein